MVLKRHETKTMIYAKLYCYQCRWFVEKNVKEKNLSLTESHTSCPVSTEESTGERLQAY